MISSTVCRQGPSKEDENMQLAANKLTLCASQAQAQRNTRHVHVRNEILIDLDFGVRSSFGGAAVEEIRKVSGPTVVFVFLRPGTRGYVSDEQLRKAHADFLRPSHADAHVPTCMPGPTDQDAGGEQSY